MPQRRILKRNDLFLLRLWTEETQDGNPQWCGKVQRTVDGDAYYFRSWAALLDLLRSMVEPGSPATSSASADSSEEGTALIPSNHKPG